ncbi:MAG: hypothetical protein O9333_10405 [Beijerinckiaceae bacterium]|nr:hypothetical protein [Beijerinckiaceae bacterium]
MRIFRQVARALIAAGLFGGLGAAAQAMSYRLVDAELAGCGAACPKIIHASGTIQQNEHLIFAEFVANAAKSHRLSSIVVVESPGGFNVGAASLGLMIRKLNMSVIVGRPAGGSVSRSTGLTSGVCASACVLVLAGGKSRYFVPGSRVGVHRAHTGPEVRDPLTRTVVSGTLQHDAIRDAYSRYFRQMGVDQSLSMVMDKTPSESMYWLSPAEMGKFRLAKTATSAR